MHCASLHPSKMLDEQFQRRSSISLFLFVLKHRIAHYQCVRTVDIQGIEDLPKYFPYSPRRVIKPLKCVLKNNVGPKGNHESLNGVENGLDDMRALLKNIWPHKCQ